MACGLTVLMMAFAAVDPGPIQANPYLGKPGEAAGNGARGHLCVERRIHSSLCSSR